MLSKRIDLVYHHGCANVEAARGLLARALNDAGYPAVWREWPTDAEDTPAELKNLGSPTVLIDGVDVCDDEGSTLSSSQATGCRVYQDESGQLRGVPPLSAIRAALSRVQLSRQQRDPP